MFAITGVGLLIAMYAMAVVAQSIQLDKLELERTQRELDNRQRLLHAEMRRFEAQKRGER
jgi:hypothetical protein